MFRIEALHESMDRTLHVLESLPFEQRTERADALLDDLERDLDVARRLLTKLNLRVPGMSGEDPLAMLQRDELDRLIRVLRSNARKVHAHWDETLVDLRLLLDSAFVAVDLELPGHS